MRYGNNYQIIAERANNQGTVYFGYEETLEEAKETVAALRFMSCLKGDPLEVWKVRKVKTDEIVFVC